MRSAWRDGERTREVVLTKLGDGRWRVEVDGEALELEATLLADGRLRLAGPGAVWTADVTAAGARRFVRLQHLDFVLDREEGRGRRAGVAGGAHGALEAPMPGVVTRVMVAAGDDVLKGQPLVAVEAMKMEHVIRSPRDGRIRSLAAKPGAMVQPGVALVELDG